MNKFISFVAGIVVTVLAVGAFAFAAPDTLLNWGTQVNSGECAKKGAPVVNVTHKVINSIDSGQGGNYWAFSNYNRNIKLWDQGDGTYCAAVQYTGRFDADAGETSPGAGGELTGKEKGAFEGGYRATIAGTLLDEPNWPTKGNVGVIDHDCSIDGNCPGAVNWVNQYFEPGYNFNYEWWGWIYHGGKDGVWKNSSEGNAGDIL